MMTCSSLAEILETRLEGGQGPLAIERVVEYMLQACEALAAEHAIGVIHREITWKRLVASFEESARATALIMFLTALGTVMGFVMTSERAAELMANIPVPREPMRTRGPDRMWRLTSAADSLRQAAAAVAEADGVPDSLADRPCLRHP